MSQQIQLRRSNVPGKVPSIQDLDLGEIGINTYDGRVFLKQADARGERIIEIGTISGSVASQVSASLGAPLNFGFGIYSTYPSYNASVPTTILVNTASITALSLFNAFTASISGSSGGVSLTLFNSFTQSVYNYTTSLNTWTSSINAWSSSINLDWYVLTSSFNAYTQSTNLFTASVIRDSASFDVRINNLNNSQSLFVTTGSFNFYSQSINIWSASISSSEYWIKNQSTSNQVADFRIISSNGNTIIGVGGSTPPYPLSASCLTLHDGAYNPNLILGSITNGVQHKIDFKGDDGSIYAFFNYDATFNYIGTSNTVITGGLINLGSIDGIGGYYIKSSPNNLTQNIFRHELNNGTPAFYINSYGYVFNPAVQNNQNLNQFITVDTSSGQFYYRSGSLGTSIDTSIFVLTSSFNAFSQSIHNWSASINSFTQSIIGAVSSSVSGTIDYIPKFISPNKLGNSILYETSSKVFVGTTTDSGDYKLQVNGKTYLNSFLNVTTSSNDVEIVRFNTSAGNSGTIVGKVYIGLSPWSFDVALYPHTWIGVEERDQGSYQGHLTFFTRGVDSDTAPTEKMRLLNDGRLLINLKTTGSEYKLQVAGDALVTGSLGVNTISPLGKFQVGDNTEGIPNIPTIAGFYSSTDSFNMVRISRNTANPRTLSIGTNDTNGYTEIQSWQSTVGMTNTPLVLQRQGGKVLLNTIIDAGPLLQIAGDTLVSGSLLVTGSITNKFLSGSGVKLLQTNEIGVISTSSIDPTTLITTASFSGSNLFIQNQNATPQVANYYITGSGTISGSLYIKTNATGSGLYIAGLNNGSDTNTVNTDITNQSFIVSNGGLTYPGSYNFSLGRSLPGGVSDNLTLRASFATSLDNVAGASLINLYDKGQGGGAPNGYFIKASGSANQTKFYVDALGRSYLSSSLVIGPTGTGMGVQASRLQVDGTGLNVVQFTGGNEFAPAFKFDGVNGHTYMYEFSSQNLSTNTSGNTVIFGGLLSLTGTSYISGFQRYIEIRHQYYSIGGATLVLDSSADGGPDPTSSTYKILSARFKTTESAYIAGNGDIWLSGSIYNPFIINNQSLNQFVCVDTSSGQFYYRSGSLIDTSIFVLTSSFNTFSQSINNFTTSINTWSASISSSEYWIKNQYGSPQTANYKINGTGSLNMLLIGTTSSINDVKLAIENNGTSIFNIDKNGNSYLNRSLAISSSMPNTQYGLKIIPFSDSGYYAPDPYAALFIDGADTGIYGFYTNPSSSLIRVQGANATYPSPIFEVNRTGKSSFYSNGYVNAGYGTVDVHFDALSTNYASSDVDIFHIRGTSLNQFDINGGYGTRLNILRILGQSDSEALTVTKLADVGVGLIEPAYKFNVGSLQYTALTASQAGTTVTGVGTSFTPSMVGNYFVFKIGYNRTRRRIASYTSATSLEVVETGTVASSSFSIYYPGFQVNEVGKTIINSHTDLGNYNLQLNGNLLVTGSSTSGSIYNRSITNNQTLNQFVCVDTSSGQFYYRSGSLGDSGITSLSAIGSSPNANAATISGSVLNLEPASSTFGGVLTTGTQSYAGDKTSLGSLMLNNLNPLLSFKQVTIDQEFRMRIGLGTGLTNSHWNVYNATTSKLGIRIDLNNNIILGDWTTAMPTGGKMFLYGGVNGANLDVRGETGDFKDQSTIELEGSDYDTEIKSVYLQYRGVAYTTGTTLGYSNTNLAQLVFNGANTSLIYTIGTTPIRFGVNSVEMMNLNTTSLDLGKSSTTRGILGLHDGTTSSKATIENITTGSFQTGSYVIHNSLTGSYDSVFMDYVITSGSNRRAGNFMATWIGSTASYTDNSTNDFGTTKGVSFGVGITGSNASLMVSISGSNGWNIKSLYRNL